MVTVSPSTSTVMPLVASAVMVQPSGVAVAVTVPLSPSSRVTASSERVSWMGSSWALAVMVAELSS